MEQAATTATAQPSQDAEYAFGRPVETYVTPRQHARLLVLRGRLQAASVVGASSTPEAR
jgi:hypothetical protein